MYGYIYKTTDIIHNKIYVGQHKSSKFDPNYYGSGIIFTKLFKKYGKDNFTREILCECDSFEELNLMEKFWIKEFDARNPEIGYNLSDGGSWGDTGYHDGMRGKSQSSKQKEAASQNGKYVRTDEWKRNKSESMKGNTNAHGNAGKPGKFTGRHHKQSTKDTLREKATQQQRIRDESMTQEERKEIGKNISAAKKGTICITDGIKNSFIHPEQWPEYEQKGYFKMSLAVYKKTIATK